MDSMNERISARRKELGLTLDEVAAFVGVNKGTVSRWESGEIDNMRRDKIAKLAEVLKVSPLFIMGMDTANAANASDELPTLTRRDEREIAKDLEDMLHSLKGFAAMGEPEDEEDVELLKASLLQAMTLSKRIAKKKFTPKKYKTPPSADSSTQD